MAHLNIFMVKCANIGKAKGLQLGQQKQHRVLPFPICFSI